MDTFKTGKFLQDLRIEHNLTQEELGEQLGVTNKTISRWETGMYIPPVDILLRLSAIYNVTVNEILSGERLTTADYQSKAEQNIVTSINNTSIVSKRSKKILIICLSVIMALIVISIVFISVLGSSLDNDSNKTYVYGDFTYKKFGDKDNGRLEIFGLSEQGKTKSVLVVPETIDGLPVSFVEDSKLFGHDISFYFASKNLKKLYFSNTNIIVNENSFDRCYNLRHVFVLNTVEDDSVSKFVFDGTNSNVYIFKDVYELEAPKWIAKEHKFAANVTYYYNYFGAENGGCYWLDEVEIGDKIEFLPPEPTRQGADKEYAFGGWYTEKDCINKWSFDSGVVPETGELNLYAKWISLDDTPTYETKYSVKQDGTVAFEGFRGYYQNSNLIIPSQIDGRVVNEIYPDAFKQLDKRNITSIEIPSTVETIGMYAFEDFKAVQSVNILDNGLKYVQQGAFANCTSLNTIRLPVSTVFIAPSAFEGCTSLYSVNIDIDSPNYTTLDGVVYSKDMETLVLYPIGKTETEYAVDSQCKIIDARAFAGSKLTDVDLNNVITVCEQAFQSCPQLISIIGDNVRYVEMEALKDTAWLDNELSQQKEFISLGKALYLYNGTAEDVLIDNFVGVSPYAFSDNKSIKTVTINNAMPIIGDYFSGSIGRYAFCGCTNLETVYILNTTMLFIGMGTFDKNADNRIIYVPHYLQDEYKSNVWWQQYETTVHQTSISYDLDGKDIDCECPATISYGEILYLQNPTNKEYYYFVGWYTDKDYTNEVKMGSWLSFDDGVVFYAKWKPATCAIKLCVGDEYNFVLLYYTYGETVELPMVVHEGGYTFEYWCEDKELTKPVDFTLLNETRGNFTLYTKLYPNTYIVTYDLNVDDLDGVTFDVVQTEVVFDQPYSLDIPTRKGYDFLGWYFFDGTGRIFYCTTDGASCFGKWNIVGNVTLHAAWFANSYQIPVSELS